MIIDTSKDNYDELQILAADARASRRRTNLWTTGLIIGGMIAASAYVSTTNDQVDQLAGENKELKRIVNDSNFRLQQLEHDRESLVSERDFYQETSKMLTQAASDLKLSDAISKISVNVTSPGTAGTTDATATPTATATAPRLANVVWVVDGSRRFPMANGDILWIPEGGFSIQYDSDMVDGVKRHKLTRFEGKSAATGAGKELSPLPLPSQPYRTTVPIRGSANCIEITLHEKSIRPGFLGGNFVDIEVLYTEKGGCSP